MILCVSYFIDLEARFDYILVFTGIACQIVSHLLMLMWGHSFMLPLSVMSRFHIASPRRVPYFKDKFNTNLPEY